MHPRVDEHARLDLGAVHRRRGGAEHPAGCRDLGARADEVHEPGAGERQELPVAERGRTRPEHAADGMQRAEALRARLGVEPAERSHGARRLPCRADRPQSRFERAVAAAVRLGEVVRDEADHPVVERGGRVERALHGPHGALEVEPVGGVGHEGRGRGRQRVDRAVGGGDRGVEVVDAPRDGFRAHAVERVVVVRERVLEDERPHAGVEVDGARHRVPVHAAHVPLRRARRQRPVQGLGAVRHAAGRRDVQHRLTTGRLVAQPAGLVRVVVEASAAPDAQERHHVEEAHAEPAHDRGGAVGDRVDVLVDRRGGPHPDQSGVRVHGGAEPALLDGLGARHPAGRDDDRVGDDLGAVVERHDLAAVACRDRGGARDVLDHLDLGRHPLEGPGVAPAEVLAVQRAARVRLRHHGRELLAVVRREIGPHRCAVEGGHVLGRDDGDGGVGCR